MGSRGKVRELVMLFVAVAAAWVVDACAPIWAKLMPWSSDTFPHLPLVAVPNAAKDVTSSVPGLFMVVFAGVASALVVEVAKAELPQRCRRLGTLILLTYQGILVVDMFRTHARDWWTWFLSWLWIIPLGSRDWREPLLPIESPWLALIGMVATGFGIYLLSRTTEQRETRQ